MTDFNSNPDALKATTDGDAGDSSQTTTGQTQGGQPQGGQSQDSEKQGAFDLASTSMGGTAGADLTTLREDMEVVGSDGGHVGEIDHFRDGQLKLKREDGASTDGQHHFLPTEWVAKIDSGANRVMLTLSKDEATSRWIPAG